MNITGLSGSINRVKGLYGFRFQNVAVGRTIGVAALTGFSYTRECMTCGCFVETEKSVRINKVTVRQSCTVQRYIMAPRFARSEERNLHGTIGRPQSRYMLQNWTQSGSNSNRRHDRRTNDGIKGFQKCLTS